MGKNRSINSMKCWVFRKAQVKWGIKYMKDLCECHNLRYIFDSVLREYVEKDGKVVDVFCKADGAQNFIKEYFEKKGKQSVFKIGLEDDELFSKSIHTVSVFCLGLYFMDIVKPFLLERVQQYIRGSMDISKQKMECEFLWFMAALYHDVSAAIERCEKEEVLPHSVDDVSKFLGELKKLQIEENILNPYDLNEADITNILLTNKCCKQAMTFSEKDVTEYFNYGLSGVRGHQSLNHGIVAGYVLFIKMVKVLKDKFAQIDEGKSYIQSGNLLFERTDIFAYQMAADAIIVHNIWYAENNEDDKNYSCFKKYADLRDNSDVHKIMGRFIYNKEKDNRLSLVKNPLAFWLGLIDTIEPFKYFGNKIDKRFLLNNLIICTDGKKQIRISQVLDVFGITVFDFKSWYDDKISGIECWLKVKVRFEQGTIVIDIL